ncbi:MAG: hypothetical protein M1838_002020 [Thelocarpon superellum]|nr:MAG: hypothetical protein M1838_002020 [Thelocarpon superellum]
MEPLSLKARPVEEEIECWDDDDDLQGDDSHFRTASIATTYTTSSRAFQQRDSISSRVSMRSDLDSTIGPDEERQVLLPADDEASTVDAIASAIDAGIPIPKDVPSSALIGGTIRRLGASRARRPVGDDWSDDLELPTVDGNLTIRKKSAQTFPDSLRQFSADFAPTPDPVKSRNGSSIAARLQPEHLDPRLQAFRDHDDEDDFLGDDGNVPTVKLTARPTGRQPITFSSALPPNTDTGLDDFEQDLEFPDDGAPLKLTTRKDMPKTPALQQDDFEEWAEGSLGTRYGGTKRDGRSNRSSSLSAMSPSMSSSFTVESEDEGLDGLVLPEGPLHLDDILKKRQENASPDPADYSGEQQAAKRAAAKEDFFSGLEIGDGDVFESGKLTLNRNIKHKAARQTSPVRRTAMTLTFTNKPQVPQTRIPRLANGRQSAGLEPVSESGGALPEARRPQSRLSGHSPHSSVSVSSIPAPSTPSASRSTAPSTPSRVRNLGNRPSMKTLRPEPTTTSAQLLKMKRSMPIIPSAQPSPAKPSFSHARPSSRSDNSRLPARPPSRSDMARLPLRTPSRSDNARPAGPSRPKTPVDRSGADSSLGYSRRPPIPPVPFLPGGTSQSQSHHVSSKSSRTFRRQDSESSTGLPDYQPRSLSRASRSTIRSPSPSQRRKALAPESLAREAIAKRTLTRPKKSRHFGDGNELEVFDDLPTSASSESRFVRAPIGRGAPKAMRSKLGLSLQSPDERAETPTPGSTLPLSPSKAEYTPRFARDTAASRIAREQRIGPAMGQSAVAPANTNWKAPASSRGLGLGPSTPPAVPMRTKRRHGAPQKPHLIKPLGDTHNNAKSVKGMHYNPMLFRWEGNENALAPFDVPLPPPSRAQGHSRQISPLSHPVPADLKLDPPSQRPALITHVNSASPTVQVVGGMVFDPHRMCWLKLSHHRRSSKLRKSSRGDVDDDIDADSDGEFDDQALSEGEDSDDPFAGLDDLDDRPAKLTASPSPGSKSRPNTSHSQASNAGRRGKSPVKGPEDEWLVGEEFDVGPEFIRRQRDEEDRWRRKVLAWIGSASSSHGSGSASASVAVVNAARRTVRGKRDAGAEDGGVALEYSGDETSHGFQDIGRGNECGAQGEVEEEEDQEWRWAIRDVVAGRL